LIIPACWGLPVNHYQVRDGDVRFRAIGQHSRGSWRTLSEQDVLMHLVLKTPVAEWLNARRGFTAGAGTPAIASSLNLKLTRNTNPYLPAIALLRSAGLLFQNFFERVHQSGVAG
jgi:hypothetical protein